MDNYIDKNELLIMLNNKKVPNEINLSLWEDEFYIWIAVCLIYGKKIGEQDYIFINKMSKSAFYEDIERYKKEAYQIKTFIKKKFPSTKVSSSFRWN